MARQKRTPDDAPSIIGEAPPETDYADLLESPVAQEDQCSHTTKPTPKSACSLCAGWVPGQASAVVRPRPTKVRPVGRARTRT